MVVDSVAVKVLNKRGQGLVECLYSLGGSMGTAVDERGEDLAEFRRVP